MIFSLMAYQPTPEDRQVQATARVAIRVKLGLLWKEAAAAIGVSPSYLHEALNGVRPLKFSLLYRIEGFRRAFLETLADEESCLVIDKREALLVEAESVRRRMLKADLDIDKKAGAA